jgi:uncharacterized protein (DUF983 family)
LQDIVGIGKKEPRCFSGQLKEVLFTSNNTCAICGQKIQEIDDSAEEVRLALRKFVNAARPEELA